MPTATSALVEPKDHLPSLRENKRLAGLDALRGIAALGVVLTHFTNTYFSIYKLPKPVLSFSCGAEAVELFFIISGFVILMTLDRSLRVADFALSRFARLFPIFWVCVGVTYAVVHLSGLPGRGTTFPQALLNLTMMPSVFGAPAVDVVYWTLTVELFFYIILGTVLALGRRRFLPAIVATFVVLGMAEHFRHLDTFVPFGYRLRHMFILDYWHLFFFGIVIYELRGQRQWWHLPGLLLCGVASFLHHGWRGGAIVCLCVAIVYAATNYRLPALTNPVFLYLGMISYSLYLVHANVGYVVLRWCYGLGASPALATSVAMAAVIGLASILCVGVERPANKFLRAKYKTASSRRIATS